MEKKIFKKRLQEFSRSLTDYVSTSDRQWKIKGFIDISRNIYTLSADTKIVSKILELHILPRLLDFAEEHRLQIVLPDHQNYYPDLTFVSEKSQQIKYAVDLKTTYRKLGRPNYCNGFTLGSHGSYFKNRDKKKNIQFPYNEYSGHFCLGAIYSRNDSPTNEKAALYRLKELQSMASVISDFQFFACEKWEIASDSHGSGNTANIGSITSIPDILAGKGMFQNLGETVFDDYWINYGDITVIKNGKPVQIKKLADFLEFRGYDPASIHAIIRSRKRRVEEDGR